jgi:hypothetical protein
MGQVLLLITKRFDRLAILVMLLMAIVSQELSLGKEPSPDKPAEAKPKCTWFQLVNISIPNNSPHRQNAALEKPPHLYIVIEQDGDQVGDSSQVKRGWRVDFPAKPENQWPIWEGSNARYTIRLMDDQYFGDEPILEITDLSGESFREPILEIGDTKYDKDKLVQFTFRKIEKTQPAK